MNLFEMKQQMKTLTDAITEDAQWISKNAANPEVSMDEITAKTKHRDELQARLNLLKAEHDAMEEAQRTQLAMQNGGGDGMTAKQAEIKAKAAFYRAALLGGDVRKAYEGLGGIPAATADLGYGDNLLPTNVSNELLLEPLEENSLRNIEPVSQIPGLEEQKLLFTIEDEDLADVTDQQTANEIAMEGSFDPDCRRCMPWNEIEQGTYEEQIAFTKELIALRKKEKLMRERNFHFPCDYENPRVIQFRKIGWSEALEIIVNSSDEDVELMHAEHGKTIFAQHVEDQIVKAGGVCIRFFEDKTVLQA